MDEWEEAFDTETEVDDDSDDEIDNVDDSRILFISDLTWTVRRYCHERSLSLFNRPDMIDIFLREFL